MTPVGSFELSKQARCTTSRRDFLAITAAASAVSACFSVGCVHHAQASVPQLVWGRRGLSEGRFLKPRAMTIDDNDRIYIVDTTGRIQVFDTEGNFKRFWKTPLTANGRPTGLAFQSAEQAADSVPKILVADTHYYRMLAYTLDGQLIERQQIGGTAGHKPGEFAFVTDAVSDQNGCFYVGEYNASDRIQKFDPDGKFITQWGGTGHDRGFFVRPQSLVIDHNEVMWVADSCNHRIQRFDLTRPKPELIDVWGEAGERPEQFFYPYDLDLCSDGSVVIVEYKNNRVQRLSPSGKCIGIWGSPGFEPGRLNQPWGIVVDSADRVHVLDSNNHRVQRIAMPTRPSVDARHGTESV